ncbi:LPS assembly lipoprotein LptE [Chitinimonas sp. BJYL2]|uniref:LPS-assembly lipoprotein LptE n=1 Tax=Chitinimonas sp. BJYL2 TaxID=2976696 RepID=UPI0022B358E9|nr:LPS assembly lipoprotein LptE [Chitinimonas sp. BJYL2]
MNLRPFLFTACLALSACGFHLRGEGGASAFAFRDISLQGSATGVGGVVQRQLSLRPELKLVGAEAAEVQLAVESEALDKQILTVNRSGRVSEYQLTLRVRFAVRQAGVTAIPSTELTLRRDYSFDENNLLGKDAEEQALVRDMRQDAAQQIIRRLAALKPVAGVSRPAA